MMTAAIASVDFALLVDEKAENTEFEPLFAAVQVPPFYSLDIAGELPDEAAEVTYQRINSPAPAVDQHPKAVDLEREQQIEKLKALLAERERDLAQIRVTSEQLAVEQKKAIYDDLSAQIVKSLHSLEEQICAGLSQELTVILEPFLSANIRQKAIVEFEAAIKRCLTGGELAKIRISGPPNLLAALKQTSADNLLDCEWVEAMTTELTAELSGKLIATRFTHWSKLLNGIE